MLSRIKTHVLFLQEEEPDVQLCQTSHHSSTSLTSRVNTIDNIVQTIVPEEDLHRDNIFKTLGRHIDDIDRHMFDSWYTVMQSQGIIFERKQRNLSACHPIHRVNHSVNRRQMLWVESDADTSRHD